MCASKLYCVYILTNRPRGVLYTGMTNDLERRIWEHRLKVNPGFTSRYNIKRLVYFECTEEAYEAIAWEKEIKRWVRRKKVALIERENPEWRDLAAEWYRGRPLSPP